jgi:phosphoribosylglycinamide formyltransferase-1
MSTAGRRPLRTAVLVSGNGSNLQAILDSAAAGDIAIRIVGVISDRSEAYALERARAAGVPAATVEFRACASRDEFGERLAAEIAALRADLVVLAGFMRILPDELVEAHLGRMLNVHPSLLPKYPGLHTYRRVLEAGDPWHGSTVHFVVPELDAGPGIIQYRVRVRATDTEQTLRARVQRGEHRIYPLAIGWVAEGSVEYRDGAVWCRGAPLMAPVIVDEDAPAGAAGS